ncbi:UNVERIFIED_CONTAM: hypothetical protein Cloal_2986 [Acetivibrio alkalicellulosi]
MDNKKEVLGTVNESVKGLMDIITTKVSSGQNQGKEFLSNLSKNIKDNFFETSGRATDFINSLKKDKIRNLERLLHINKKDIIASSKKSNVYNTVVGKMVIIERDIWGEPCTVTIKDVNKVVLKCVKYFNNRPYLFPPFSEKKINGEIIFMCENEIWYKNNDEATVVIFIDDTPDILNIKLNKTKTSKKTEMLEYIEKCKMLYVEKKFNDILIVQRKLDIEDIMVIRKGYSVYKNSDKSYTILIFDEFKSIYDELILSKLPVLSEKAMALLFSTEISDYIKSKGYSFENFKQVNDFIEYWQDIGTKKICVMRVKI